jgi:uncharacterized protein
MDLPNPDHVLRLAQELNLKVHQVAAAAQLLAEGATVPFISRYRKEATGLLDEVQVTAIRDRLEQMQALDERRAGILASLKERNLLTPELEKSIHAATTLTTLEDIYAPFRPKKRTRATLAKEKGLEPLADLLWAQDAATNPVAAAQVYVGRDYTPEDGKNQPQKIADTEEALAGARDILAERISDDKNARARLRAVYQAQAVLSSKVLTGKQAEAAKFKDYFEWSEPLAKAPSHRVLAIRRGESESMLIMRVTLPDELVAPAELEPLFVRARNPAAEQVRLAVQDAAKRLLGPAMETEMRLEAKKRADEVAIKVFADNLRELLFAAPLGQKAVLAIDPGFRTGCKVVLLDRQGKLLHNDVVYPDRHEAEAKEKLTGFVKFFNVEAVAIGNGTGGRETEAFVRGLGLPPAIPVVMVNESGASIYSASDVAREEFPDHDLTVRGAVSIGRRLMDPLAELVKLDPKSIGVGQYQHDVDQPALRRSLDDTVVSTVNGVGVEVNTASKQLLSYVSGLNAAIAAAIVARRNEKGPFKSRAELKEVPRLGPKAFEQAAGFLRIRGADNPLDASAVHPESYAHRRENGGRPRRQRRRPDARRESPRETEAGKLRERESRPAHADRHRRRTGQARARSARAVRGLQFFRRREQARGSEAGHEAARHRDERHGLRCLRGRRRASGRPRAREPAGRCLCEGSLHGREARPESHGDRDRDRSRPQTHRSLDAQQARARRAARQRGHGQASHRSRPVAFGARAAAGSRRAVRAAITQRRLVHRGAEQKEIKAG